MFNKKLLNSKSGLSFEISEVIVTLNNTPVTNTITFITDCDYNGWVCTNLGAGILDLNSNTLNLSKTGTYVDNYFCDGYCYNYLSDKANRGIFSIEANTWYTPTSTWFQSPHGYHSRIFNTDNDGLVGLGVGSQSNYFYNVDINYSTLKYTQAYEYPLDVTSGSTISYINHGAYTLYDKLYALNPSQENFFKSTKTYSLRGRTVPDPSEFEQISYSNTPFSVALKCISEYGYSTSTKNKNDYSNCGKIFAGSYFVNNTYMYTNVTTSFNDNLIHYTLDGINFEVLDYELPATQMFYRWIGDSFWICGANNIIYRVKVKGL